MQDVEVSVVVATCNRAEMLGIALGSLAEQEGLGERGYEIVVIDDGSSDATAEAVAHVARRDAVPVRYVYQAGSGVAAARNRGLAEAAGRRVVFFDDD